MIESTDRFPRFTIKNVLILTALTAIALWGLLNVPTTHRGSSSASVKHARSRGVFVAEYAVPTNANLGNHWPIEVWVETTSYGDHAIIVRLGGSHHNAGSVQIAGFDQAQLRSIWSARNAPPYQVWEAPSPLPDTLKLESYEKSVEVQLRKNTDGLQIRQF